MKKLNDLMLVLEALSVGPRVDALTKRLEAAPRDEHAVASAEKIVGKKHEKSWSFEGSTNTKPSTQASAFAEYHGYHHEEGKGMTKDGKNYTSIGKVLSKHGASKSLINAEAAIGTRSGASGKLTLIASIKPRATVTMSNNGTEKNPIGSFESCKSVDAHASPDLDFGRADQDGANSHFAYAEHKHATMHFTVHNENGDVIGRVSAVHHDGYDGKGNKIVGGGRHILTNGHFGNIPDHIMDHIKSVLEKPAHHPEVTHYIKHDNEDTDEPTHPYDDDSTAGDIKHTQKKLDRLVESNRTTDHEIVAQNSTSKTTLHKLFKNTTDEVGRNAQEAAMHETIASNQHISPETQHALFNLHRGNMRGTNVLNKLATNKNLHPDVANKLMEHAERSERSPDAFSKKVASNVMASLVMNKACPEHIREKLVNHSENRIAAQSAIKTSIPEIARRGLEHPDSMVREYAMKNPHLAVVHKANHFSSVMNHVERTMVSGNTSDKDLQMHIANRHAECHDPLASNGALHPSVADAMLNHPELKLGTATRIHATLKRTGAPSHLVDKARDKMDDLTLKELGH